MNIGFGSVVYRSVGPRLVGACRSYIQDLASTTPDHICSIQARQFGHRRDVQGDQSFVYSVIGFYDRAAGSGTGIVDQQIDGTFVLPGPLQNPLRRIGLSQVLGQNLYTHRMLSAQITGDQFQSLCISGDQGQVPAIHCQLTSQCCPDPG